MVRASILGAVVVIALVNVVVGLLPVTVTGQEQLAVWLVSILLGVFTYVTLEGKMRQPQRV